MLTNHPGGFEIVKNIRGREIDRYIYGSEVLESFEKMPVHHHTASSIRLAGEPIGILANTPSFMNMGSINTVYLQYMGLPCKNKYMYAPYLTSVRK